MHRLYLQIYGALLGVLLLLSILIAAAFWHLDRQDGPDTWRAEITNFANAVVPPIGAPPEELARVLESFAKPLDLDVSVFTAEGLPIYSVGTPLTLPRPEHARPDAFPRRHAPMHLELEDGRHLVLGGRRRHRPVSGLFAAIALLGLATAIVAFPLARRLTRRLESLKTQVERLGEGRLAARVPVEGQDEIAELARAMNATAERIEQLVADKSRLLAMTSHELRTPLTRVRVALELMREGPRPELLDRVERDIEELDALIGELLISSRLDAPEQQLEREPVDLLAMAAEEGARLSGVEVFGESATVEGDPRLLRRLLRNLLQNALRHGEPPVRVEIRCEAAAKRVRLTVEDRGPGLPPSERDRVFEPFYRPAGQSNADGGIGLGLALVRQICERHDGRIRYEAREGGGARFVLELPLG